MGFVSDIVGGLFGNDAADASTDAAAAQVASTEKSIAFQKESLEKILENLKPFREAGAAGLNPLQKLILDPEEQKKYVAENPFFTSLTDKAKSDLFANNAARGKVGSGGTAAALQDRLLAIGTDLVDKGITQRQNLVSVGANAAAGQGNATQSTGNSVSNLLTQQGNATASGIVGAANARTAASQNLINTGMTAAAMFLSDVRAKENIKRVGTLLNGLPVYLFNYIGDKKRQISVMAQDVEKIMPEAVKEISGWKMVNMEMVCQ